jgi:hypothetical protein
MELCLDPYLSPVLINAIMLSHLRMAIEPNTPVRIAEPAITDARLDNIILGQSSQNHFFTALAALLPVLQAASIAPNVLTNPIVTSMNKLIRSTITSYVIDVNSTRSYL